MSKIGTEEQKMLARNIEQILIKIKKAYRHVPKNIYQNMWRFFVFARWLVVFLLYECIFYFFFLGCKSAI